MRLKKIKLAGFKSFVDPTSIALPGNLIGIVGPNGCGKSNVIDAVRWVMGESSAKHLRGDSMADVIFNGSAGRKPVGQAAIELVFDNSQGALGGQYASYSEIAIKRQVTRDGQSQYSLNGSRCRRKDITDIFLGTGLGPRSYAIIEQGTISRLIEARPEELRVFLEEAAGVSKYKERRRETENRIRHTKDNLNRLNDVRDELEKRLQVLQRQAKTAERYKTLKQEERLLNGQLQALRWRVLNDEVVAGEQSIRALETRMEAETAGLRRIEASLEEARVEHSEENERFNAAQAQVYEAGAEVARLEQAIAHVKQTRAQQQRELAESDQAWEELQNHLDDDRALVEQLGGELGGIGEQLSEARTAEEQSRVALACAEQSMHDWQRLWDEFNSRAAAQLQAAEVERARIDHLEERLAQLRGRLRRVDEELTGLDALPLEDEIHRLTEAGCETDAGLAEAQGALEGAQARIAEVRHRQRALQEKLDELRTTLQHKQGRRASLEALQEQALGAGQDVLGQWLRDHGLADLPRLAQSLEVEPKWEQAVETVLGHALEALCVDGLADKTAAVTALKQGELTLFDTAHPAPAAQPATGLPRLMDKLRAPWPLDAVLGGVYAADSVGQAWQWVGRLGARECVVTPEGLCLGPGWMRVSRSQDATSGVLARERLLQELQKEISEAEEKLNAAEHQYEDAAEQLSHWEKVRDEAQLNLQDATRQRAELKARLSSRQERLSQLSARRATLADEARLLEEDLSEAESGLLQARQRLENALAETEGHGEQRERLLEQRDHHRRALEQCRAAAREHSERRHAVALKAESLRSRLQATEANQSKMQAQLEHLAHRRGELQHALAGGDGPVLAMERELEEALARRQQRDESLAAARRRVDEWAHRLRELAEGRTGAEQRVHDVREELDQARLACQALAVRRQGLDERLNEAGYTAAALLEELPGEADEPTWAARLEALEKQIQRLGAINLAAIDEYTEQAERKAYLDAQHADLCEALDTLESAIRKIDKETKQRFQDTFDRVNSGLQAMFPRLFGGGHAYLELTGDDLLNTGVTVMARPPGKRNSTIHLLSGGEKALTAVALVFAIFELNPAPFCMLDEVDAPLDDANVGRFSRLLQEMSERVQFIFITHNKVTMEICQQLLGVTMHEPGVSRLVAVDVDEAVELAAAS
ncbi:MAG TPA: chromosome segregation protein SMC [Gammaproteobacteria bacterium]|nr:chromosome segregation protein SMC [Gammaproteobacteria bacterium]